MDASPIYKTSIARHSNNASFSRDHNKDVFERKAKEMEHSRLKAA